ncbi:MAG: hypothetical protein JXR84_05255 [Anaerolineae bacterium]|nr:hypothetical protein [Anaerolineae bacterium]
MYYKFALEKHDDYWVYTLTFEKNIPTTVGQANEYADDCISAEDKHGIRHYVLLKGGKIVQIQLHQALQIMPYLDPDDPASIRMPAMQAIMFGNPLAPSLLLVFKESGLQDATAYGLSPNVYLVFDDSECSFLRN